MSAFDASPLDDRRIIGGDIFVFMLMLGILPDLIRIVFRLPPQATNRAVSIAKCLARLVPSNIV